VVADRNRGAAYLAVLIAGAGMFGIFLFLTYYLQQTLGYSPVVSGVAFLPMIAMVVVGANLSNVALLPRVGPKPLVTVGMLLCAASLAWLTRIGVHSGYATTVLGPLIGAGLGFGFTIAPSMNTGTFGVAPQDAGVASATLNTGQQIGGSIGTSLLNTIFASATASYLASHLSPATLAGGRPAPSLIGMSLIHGYTTGFWVAAAIFGAGAVICGTLFRFGPLRVSGPAAAPVRGRRASGGSAFSRRVTGDCRRDPECQQAQPGTRTGDQGKHDFRGESGHGGHRRHQDKQRAQRPQGGVAQHRSEREEVQSDPETDQHRNPAVLPGRAQRRGTSTEHGEIKPHDDAVPAPCGPVGHQVRPASSAAGHDHPPAMVSNAASPRPAHRAAASGAGAED
jgi:hypothetical protein